VHPDPAHARSDGLQSLTPAGLEALMPRLAAVARAVGREV
jgi:3-deoxy-7-phosphoheptulonate synthase